VKAKSTTIILKDESLRRRVLEVVGAIALDGPLMEVVVREHKKNRSLDANALYWKWLTVIGAELGESKDELHERFKEKWLVSIYERDDPDFADMLQSLRAVYRQGMRTEALALRKRIVVLTSTTTATVAQMAEYMQSVEHFAAETGIRLPFPEEQ
jgi:hypothetical protein